MDAKLLAPSLPLLLALGGTGAADPPAIVACAPGYPGSTAEAQPTFDAFAAAVSGAAGLGRGGLTGVYHESEAAGLERLSRPDAAFALVPLSFFLKHENALGLVSRAQAVPQGGEANETWSLVAGKGRLLGAAGLDGWQIVSRAGYAPRFVKGAALGSWGKVPASARVVASSAVLSDLEKAAAGEKVALLLDPAQAAVLSSLPFAAQLEVVTRSAPMPAVVFCTVAGRAGGEREGAVAKAILELERHPGGPAALLAVRIQEFVPVDEAALKRARSGYAAAAEAASP